MTDRLTRALDEGGLVLPETGRLAVYHPRAGMDLSALPRDRTVVIQPVFPDHAAFRAAGFDCAVTPAQAGGPFAAALVAVPRAKAQTRALIADAMAQTQGQVIVDGAKTDGIDSLLKDMRARVRVSEPVSKAHGKLFWTSADAQTFADWQATPSRTPEGFVTAPGSFSADAVDPASRVLADSLPAVIGTHVADLGAGWGYLSSRLLERADIETLDLVEADHDALDCARLNVTDPRARFHWADARDWQPPGRVDAVVMNPPFHDGRSADPALGRAFIAAAARVLAPGGRLWLVANRHLPYETALRDGFATVTEIAGDSRFKVLNAEKGSARRLRPRRGRPQGG